MSLRGKDEENETEAHMRQVLTSEGFQIIRMPSGVKRTADYRVSDDRDAYLIEVVRKEDAPSVVEQFDQDFREKGKAERREPAGWTNGMAKIIRDKADQLASTTASSGEFKIIWFSARGQSPELQIDQFRSTLYGEQNIVTADGKGGSLAIPCFYYTFSEFYRLRGIDGAIATTETHGGFYLNTFSPRADELKNTKLFKMFERFESVCDPVAMEESGNALIFDRDTDRRDKGAVYMALCQKYRFGPCDVVPLVGDVVIARIGLRSLPAYPENGTAPKKDQTDFPRCS